MTKRLPINFFVACYTCNANGYFNTLERATELGWIEIVDANYQELGDDGDGELADGDEMLNWYSHIGYCPNCTEEVVEPSQRELF